MNAATRPTGSTSTAAVDERRAGKDRRPLRTSVIGSYPFPGWLEFASAHLDEFGEADIEEMRADAVIAAVHDQLHAGLDVITDGEQSRYDFNLSFYGRLEGIRATPFSPRRFGPPAHDQRGKYPAGRRTDSQGQRPRPLYSQWPHRDRCDLPQPMGSHRRIDPDRPRRARTTGRSWLPGDYAGRAFHELLRISRGSPPLREDLCRNR